MQDNSFKNQLLTPHFRLREFTASRTASEHNIVNVPSELEVENLRRLCEGCLEPLREKLGLPVIITSGYRTRALNDIIVHAARKSQHMAGQAADFVVQGSRVQSSRELLIRAFRLIIQDEDIDFDQLILYPSFIHVSFVSKQANRHKLTKANGQGTYCALTREQALSIV